MPTNPIHYLPRDKQIAPNAAEIMRHVAYALIPGALLASFFYGAGVIIQIVLASLTALVCEWLVAKCRVRKLTALDISSGWVTAFLLALSIPPTAPYIVIVSGVAFAILIGKHVYGGVGMNIFNPAMVGFCAVYLSFSADIGLYPMEMVSLSNSWSLIFSSDSALDSLTGATALASLKANGQGQAATLGNMHLWLNVAWLVGGVYLWVRNFADWRLSVTFLAVFALGTLLFAPWTDLDVSFSQHIGLGALVFTACFIVTDPTTAATGRKGRVIYAALCGALAVIIRQLSHMPDSMAFSILLANTCAPLIDSYTRPEYYRG